LSLAGFGLLGWLTARAKAQGLNTGKGALHSLPRYHAWHLTLWALIPALVALIIWSAVSPGLIQATVLASPEAASLPADPMERDSILAEAFQLAANPGMAAFNPLAEKFVGVVQATVAKFNWIGSGLVLLLAFCGGGFGYTRVKAKFPARTRVEMAILGSLLVASLLAILTTVGIIASLIFETWRFFSIVSPVDFLAGIHWNPQDGSGPEVSQSYGAVPLFWGTIFIGAIIAMIVAIPLGLMSAIYLTQYASSSVRKWRILRLKARWPPVWSWA
jgi:phosphate transport system permease protein